MTQLAEEVHMLIQRRYQRTGKFLKTLGEIFEGQVLSRSVHTYMPAVLIRKSHTKELQSASILFGKE